MGRFDLAMGRFDLVMGRFAVRHGAHSPLISGLLIVVFLRQTRFPCWLKIPDALVRANAVA